MKVKPIGFYKKAKRLLESGCKGVSCPIGVSKNINPGSPSTLKANPPPKFSSASIGQHQDTNGRNEMACDLKSCRTKTKASLGNLSSKCPPQCDSRDNGDQFGGKELVWEGSSRLDCQNWVVFDMALQNVVLNFYGKCGSSDYAGRLFELMEN